MSLSEKPRTRTKLASDGLLHEPACRVFNGLDCLCRCGAADEYEEQKKSEAFQQEQMKKLDELAKQIQVKESERAIDDAKYNYNKGWNAALDAVAFKLMGWSGDPETFPVNIAEMKK